MSIDDQPPDIGNGEQLSQTETNARRFADKNYPSLAFSLKEIGIASGVKSVECDAAALRALIGKLDTSDDPYVVGELKRWGGGIGERAKIFKQQAKSAGVPSEKAAEAELSWLRQQVAGTLASAEVRRTLRIGPDLLIRDMGDKGSDVSTTIGLALDIAKQG